MPESSTSPSNNPSSNTVAFQLFNEIGIIEQLSTNVFQRHLPEGLTLPQFGVLNWFIRVDREATPGRLATAFMVTKGAMTNTLKRLEAKGFVDIRPDENSGRSKRVTITRAGQQARQRAIKNINPVLAELLETFPVEEFSAVLPFLTRLRKHLDEQRYKLDN